MVELILPFSSLEEGERERKRETQRERQRGERQTDRETESEKRVSWSNELSHKSHTTQIGYKSSFLVFLFFGWQDQ